jgi:hypothetical protein
VNEKKLPSDVNVRFLYQPGELEGNTSLLIHLPLTGVFLMVNVVTDVSQPFYVKLSKQNLNQRKRS